MKVQQLPTAAGAQNTDNGYIAVFKKQFDDADGLIANAEKLARSFLRL